MEAGSLLQAQSGARGVWRGIGWNWIPPMILSMVLRIRLGGVGEWCEVCFCRRTIGCEGLFEGDKHADLSRDSIHYPPAECFAVTGLLFSFHQLSKQT